MHSFGQMYIHTDTHRPTYLGHPAERVSVPLVIGSFPVTCSGGVLSLGPAASSLRILLQGLDMEQEK